MTAIMEAGGRAADAGSQATAPIFQVHATRRCNLRCLHCYSESSPWARDTLTHETIIEALAGAREQGYQIASFSGGEPVLYQGLGSALRHAKSLGMRTTVTSNGMLLKGARLDALREHTDVLAISLDGVPESHDRMRNHPGAFDRMAANLAAVRATGIDFGFIFTLTLHNVHELEWAANFALSQGAKLFQIHPLEEVGRAADDLPGSRPDELESAFAYIESERIRRLFQDRMFVQFDLFHRDHMARCPERFYADENWSPGVNLAECVSPLVLEADGNLVPMGYGFGRRYSVGCVRDRRMGHLVPYWIANVYPEFRDLCRQVYAEAIRPSKLPFVNWYEMLHAAAVRRTTASESRPPIGAEAANAGATVIA